MTENFKYYYDSSIHRKGVTLLGFCAILNVGDISMKTKYYRKISDNRGYATISLPVELYREWTENGATHVEILYNGEKLIVSPV